MNKNVLMCINRFLFTHYNILLGIQGHKQASNKIILARWTNNLTFILMAQTCNSCSNCLAKESFAASTLSNICV